MTDRDRTVSRRSKPSSRTALTGEQPDPWNLLQLQDAMSRHRGAKPERRCELLAQISLLSPAYLYPLSDGPSTRNHRITKAWLPTCSSCRTRSQARFCLCTLRLISKQPERTFAPPLQFRRRPPQSNYPPSSVPDLDDRSRLERRSVKGGISLLAPPSPRSLGSKPPTYPAHNTPAFTTKM